MKIVVLDGRALEPDQDRWSELRSVAADCELNWYPRTESDEVISRSADAEILVVNKVSFGSPEFSALPKLKLIAVSATGYDVIDLDAAAAAGVTVCNVPVYSTLSVAQHVFACVLSVIHRPREHDHAIRDGRWQAENQFTFWLAPLTELAGKTMGIVGFGRIGQATARLAKAFGMQIRIHSRTRREVAGFEDAIWMGLPELFSESDIISLHCPQTDSNRQFVNGPLLARTKPTAILVNTARGGLVNEADLAAALNQGQLAAACLDVASSEPINDDNPLLAARNCLITPHNAWTSTESRARCMQQVAENIRMFLDGQPINTVAAG